MERELFDKVLTSPKLDSEEFQDVFAFVESITGQNISIDHLTPTEVEMWNSQFGEVIEHFLMMIRTNNGQG